jgi:hypothetical protein
LFAWPVFLSAEESLVLPTIRDSILVNWGDYRHASSTASVQGEAREGVAQGVDGKGVAREWERKRRVAWIVWINANVKGPSRVSSSQSNSTAQSRAFASSDAEEMKRRRCVIPISNYSSMRAPDCSMGHTMLGILSKIPAPAYR